MTHSRGDGRGLGGVDTECHPSKDTIRNVTTKECIFVEGVNSTGAFLTENTIFGICGKNLGVAGIWRSEFNGRDEILVEESLTDVARSDVVTQRAVHV